MSALSHCIQVFPSCQNCFSCTWQKSRKLMLEAVALLPIGGIVILTQTLLKITALPNENFLFFSAVALSKKAPYGSPFEAPCSHQWKIPRTDHQSLLRKPIFRTITRSLLFVFKKLLDRTLSVTQAKVISNYEIRFSNYLSRIPRYGALANWESFWSKDLEALSPAMAAAYPSSKPLGTINYKSIYPNARMILATLQVIPDFLVGLILQLLRRTPQMLSEPH